MSVKKLTVKDFRNQLKDLPSDMEITFGSSKYRKRPLIFSRFKSRGDDLVLIELNELDNDSEPISEIDCRTTVEFFLNQLSLENDNSEIQFGSSLDGVPLEFRELKPILSIDIEQNTEPKYAIEGD